MIDAYKNFGRAMWISLVAQLAQNIGGPFSAIF